MIRSGDPIDGQFFVDPLGVRRSYAKSFFVKVVIRAYSLLGSRGLFSTKLQGEKLLQGLDLLAGDASGPVKLNRPLDFALFSAVFSPTARMDLSRAKVVSRELLRDEEAVWTKLVRCTYTDPLGRSRTWESAERRTRPKDAPVDGVGIIAILKKADDEAEIVLQKQFRPPVDQVCVELPAGLIEEGESIETCALRELREETGYVGTVVEGSGSVSALMFNDPGFCNTNQNLVHVAIDMTRPENQDPKPSLEENEFIEVFSVPLTRLYEQCRQMEKDGYAIDARVGTLAEGFEVAKRWKL
ncbi:MAG: hypothetical protein M1816_007593 [Peltula sp. TS41687]|nr:MAG: hypothetical protein M1816_007593 [Peltula sp. TS41687]